MRPLIVRCPGSVATGLLAAVILLCAPQASAREPAAWSRFTMTVAGFRPDIDTRVRLDASDVSLGTELDLETDLAMQDDGALIQYLAQLRLTRRFAVEASYYELARNGTTTLDVDVQFGSIVFPLALEVDSRFDVSVAALSLRYAFFQNDRVELAASLGASLLSLRAGINANDGMLVESAEVDSPVPTVGLAFGWNLTRNLRLTLAGDYLSLGINEFEGSIGNYRAGLQYRVLRYLGIGIGYDVFDLNVESRSRGFSGLLKYQFKGPKAFVSMMF
ncbi:MAG: hypothetical protein E2O52_10140 [Gammaproteobacteria bacterium]|nr:MAG: hypothetical protein E2O52_10140 [Gammaproteobacteria bacterium]